MLLRMVRMYDSSSLRLLFVSSISAMSSRIFSSDSVRSFTLSSGSPGQLGDGTTVSSVRWTFFLFLRGPPPPSRSLRVLEDSRLSSPASGLPSSDGTAGMGTSPPTSATLSAAGLSGSPVSAPAAGSMPGMGSSESFSSSTICALCTTMVPCRLSASLTFTFFTSRCDGTSTVYFPSSFAMPGIKVLSSAYSTRSSKDSLRRNVTTLTIFMSEFWGKTSLHFSTGPPPGSQLPVVGICHPRRTPNLDVSSTLNSRALNSGERMAACSVQPRATHSSAFMVVESSLPPKACEHISLTHGTREQPPHISTKSTALTGRPLAALAASSTSLTFFIIGLHMSRNFSRSIWLLKSSSSIRHSQLTPASELAERIFFVFVTASSSLKDAFLLESGSQPTCFLNCAANSRIKHSSMSRPPTLSDFSHRHVSLPRVNWKTDTEKIVWPMLQNATVMGFSGSKSLER
mmetsp:Transcript_58896/g.167610  ORF Transcript_58896/g.167610 Transcript_58896/m.167610 type:complete len:458 (-) Transcript_58896:642-2015(-)